jgi:hypothetical protein
MRLGQPQLRVNADNASIWFDSGGIQAYTKSAADATCVRNGLWVCAVLPCLFVIWIKIRQGVSVKIPVWTVRLSTGLMHLEGRIRLYTAVGTRSARSAACTT